MLKAAGTGRPPSEAHAAGSLVATELDRIVAAGGSSTSGVGSGGGNAW
jgi:hypothetical protein